VSTAAGNFNNSIRIVSLRQLLPSALEMITFSRAARAFIFVSIHEVTEQTVGMSRRMSTVNIVYVLLKLASTSLRATLSDHAARTRGRG
jgi:hypothetical protein